MKKEKETRCQIIRCLEENIEVILYEARNLRESIEQH